MESVPPQKWRSTFQTLPVKYSRQAGNKAAGTNQTTTFIRTTPTRTEVLENLVNVYGRTGGGGCLLDSGV